MHTATLHKPHVATHARQDFVDTNITGTLNLLEEAAAAHVGAFVYTSTTSAFGAALTLGAGDPAAWVVEEVAPVPKNIYGVTKLAAEGVCELFARQRQMALIVLRTSRLKVGDGVGLSLNLPCMHSSDAFDESIKMHRPQSGLQLRP